MIVQNVLRDTNLTTSLLDRELAKCGASVDEYAEAVDERRRRPHEPRQGARSPWPTFKNAGITTILNLGIAFASQNISSAADAQRYYPEWIFTLVRRLRLQPRDPRLLAPGQPASVDHRHHVDRTADAAVRQGAGVLAAKEVDPTIDPGADLSMLQDFTQQYRALLVLASGIQMAGPNLTPQTLGAALKKTKFPYPADDPIKSGRRLRATTTR